MGIGEIGPINNYNDYKKIEKKEKSKKIESSDSVEISKEALQKAEANRIMETIKNTPDVRADKIAEIKAKINDPDYINDSVLNTVADKILEMFKI
ncbi:MAG TPA: flagellar biosynthesis anti-sigma factor FlgM [Spirochaetota bacterium]|nr:flagellar biosynthesis anti-sigma factor FlgM [Spirochaetota bacterium]HOL57786.1 flagellar biosynthesis anti-sigma factor FlgM [Spirochaetota bacterium]HPP05402.1 flagellar biosynthesis anti-sigma factor FlgM [Spirochaetota bacterium]